MQQKASHISFPVKNKPFEYKKENLDKGYFVRKDSFWYLKGALASKRVLKNRFFCKYHNQMVQNDNIILSPCSYIHNYRRAENDPLDEEQYAVYLEDAPAFTRE